MKPKRKVLFAAVTAALGGFLFGFDTAVISGAEQSIQKLFALNGFWQGFTVAIALIGTVVGAFCSGKPSEVYGRKRLLYFIGILYGISAIGSALANGWYEFLLFRFLGGLGVGASSVVSPMYISEISPAKLRGRLVALFQLNVVSGILASFFSNYILAGIGAEAWRWMLGVEFAPCLVFLVLLIFIPESPRWLVKKKRITEARSILEKLENGKVDKELFEIVSSLNDEQMIGNQKLFTKAYKLPIIFAVLVALFNQLSGINALMYFAPRIFQMAGLSQGIALLQSVGIGITNFIFTVAALFLIDKFGRRTLLLIGSIGMISSLGMVSFTFYTQDFNGYKILIYLMIFIAFFALSEGAVVWVFISEIFPNRIRGKGQALGSFTHWFSAAAVSWIFPIAAEGKSIGTASAFLFFCIMMVLLFIFAWKFMPETKGKSLEQIEKDLQILIQTEQKSAQDISNIA